ncbi:outer membrane lipoprotein carrier protein LolA [Paenibacillus psychroresistens]|uniref:Outer membrane lipoprotein carrier protein LolA n=1 Tax=Paenibacillus psychroresistens TaxID=1778678 RepID=A0A6B8RSC5_9BACL|nr:outer membrane lipoprotein carrier protein LolA [Paenibacillus psychroresistens]QGQ98445.1 outer membrane lipoprotein carrier protein LolA [Paenibacillus psychroresistens]
MRRITWIIALVVGVTMVLAGCGKKDAGSVVNDLDQLVGKMDSYQASGTMTLQTGQEPQDYQVEVWYKSKNYYRISLVNEKKDISQIVLRNDEGVFVLTPHLNKSFRFKSDWPERQGQVYLYQSLVQSIVDDKARQFTVDNGAYVFDVTANYQNASNLARQRIWLNKKNYAPQHVEVSDANANVKVIVDFKQFEFGKKFDKDSFDMKRNMTAGNMNILPLDQEKATGNVDPTIKDLIKPEVDKATVGTVAPEDKAVSGTIDPVTGATIVENAEDVEDAALSGTPVDGKKSPDDKAVGETDTPITEPVVNPAEPVNPANPQEEKLTFGAIDPSYTPLGVKQVDIAEITLGGTKAILMRYAGDYNYSIVESKPQVEEAMATVLNGDIVDLGFTLAVITGDEMKSLQWLQNGMEFKLSSSDLPEEEMIKVAMAFEGQSSK